MVDINYLGHSCFRIKGKKTVILVDPFNSSIGLKFPKELSANIILSSHDHLGHNNYAQITGSPVIITGPGEYEIQGVGVLGKSTIHKSDKEKIKNTIYKFTIDKINFLHLGDLGEVIKSDFLADFNDIDVLMVPVGDEITISPKEISEMISELEPSIVLPMHYKTSKHENRYEKLMTLDEYKKKSSFEFQSTGSKLGIAKEKLPDQTIFYFFE